MPRSVTRVGPTLVLLMIGPIAHAQAPGANAFDRQACLDRRAEIGRTAQTIADPDERVRLFLRMPDCGEPPPPPPPASSPPTSPSTRAFIVVDGRPVAVDGAPVATQAKPAERNITITFNPLASLVGAAMGGMLVIGSAEVRLRPHFGLAVVGGAGSLPTLLSDATTTVVAVGSELIYYPSRAFSGPHIAFRALYAHAESGAGQGLFGPHGSGEASGVSVAPLAGWKIVGVSGFTFLAQIGLAVSLINDDGPQLGGAGALNIGWSM